MVRGLISGCDTPGGMRSKLVCSFWLRLHDGSVQVLADLETHDERATGPGLDVE